MLSLKGVNLIMKKLKGGLNRKLNKKSNKKEVVDKELAQKCMEFLTKSKYLFQKLLKKQIKLKELFTNC